MTEVVSFQTALEMAGQYKKRHLLLGNGFSIACDPNIFTYRSLYEQARETHFLAIPEAARMFEVFDTKDFEVVICALEDTAKTLPVFEPTAQHTADKMQCQAGELKTALVRTIADNHPEIPNRIVDEKFWTCRQFLSHFLNTDNEGRVYTVNYDLLLYWATLHEDQPFSDPLSLTINDGFGRVEWATSPATLRGKARRTPAINESTICMALSICSILAANSRNIHGETKAYLFSPRRDQRWSTACFHYSSPKVVVNRS